MPPLVWIVYKTDFAHSGKKNLSALENSASQTCRVMIYKEKRGEYSFHISDATTSRYLGILEKEGKIKQSGTAGRWVSYVKVG